MDREVAQRRGKAGLEDWLDSQQALTLAFAGHLQEARKYWDLAFDLARRSDQTERAAQFRAGRAVREALFGEFPAARSIAVSALAVSRGRDVASGAALARDTSESGKIAAELESRFPEDSTVQLFYVPEIRALLALKGGDSGRALELLQPVGAYETGTPPSSLFGSYGTFYPIYVRGLAYLSARRGAEAAAAFRKIISGRSIIMNDPMLSVARLQLARSLAGAGDQVGARAAYQDFFEVGRMPIAAFRCSLKLKPSSQP